MSMLEDRVQKLQDELTLKTELATMWRRSTEKAGGVAMGEAKAAAVTWKLEAERSIEQGERWKAAARKAEEVSRAKEEEALRLKTEMQARLEHFFLFPALSPPPTCGRCGAYHHSSRVA